MPGRARVPDLLCGAQAGPGCALQLLGSCPGGFRLTPCNTCLVPCSGVINTFPADCGSWESPRCPPSRACTLNLRAQLAPRAPGSHLQE